MEIVLAILGLLSTGLTFWSKRKAVAPLEEQIEILNLEKKELIDRLARAINQIKNTEKLVLRYKKEAYDKMDDEELIAAWNRGLFLDDDPDPSDHN